MTLSNNTNWVVQSFHKDKTSFVENVEDYEGQEILFLACTQRGELSSYKQNKLVESWMAFLPTIDLKEIHFLTRVPQKLFDAACQVNSLEGLYVKWSGDGIKNYEQARNLTNLKRLYLGDSTQISDVSPLADLTNLEWLQLIGQKQVKNLSPISNLKKLEGLSISGSRFGVQKIESLSPLRKLENLRVLYLTNLYSMDLDLSPLLSLKNLELLDVANRYPTEEYARLAAQLPKNCDHGFSGVRDRGFKCDKCNDTTLVEIMDKRKRYLCKVCDSDKVAIAEERFKELRAKYL